VSPTPVCPRCRSAAHVVRRGVGTWLCLDCLQRVRHLSLAVAVWRLWEELDRITREAA
jgi:ribosomal protein L37AE/L43A